MEALLGEREVRDYQKVMLDIYVFYLDRRHAALRAGATAQVAPDDGRGSSGADGGSHSEGEDGNGPKLGGQADRAGFESLAYWGVDEDGRPSPERVVSGAVVILCSDVYEEVAQE